MMTRNPKYIFVYGSLRRGRQPLNGWQRQFGAQYVGRGFIRAGLYNLGRYPGVIPSEKFKTYGEVYRLTNKEPVLKHLDRYEGYDPEDHQGSLFVRKPINVTLENGRRVVAWVYFYNKRVSKERLIPSGEYS